MGLLLSCRANAFDNSSVRQVYRAKQISTSQSHLKSFASSSVACSAWLILRPSLASLDSIGRQCSVQRVAPSGSVVWASSWSRTARPCSCSGRARLISVGGWGRPDSDGAPCRREVRWALATHRYAGKNSFGVTRLTPAWRSCHWIVWRVCGLIDLACRRRKPSFRPRSGAADHPSLSFRWHHRPHEGSHRSPFARLRKFVHCLLVGFLSLEVCSYPKSYPRLYHQSWDLMAHRLRDCLCCRSKASLVRQSFWFQSSIYPQKRDLLISQCLPHAY